MPLLTPKGRRKITARRPVRKSRKTSVLKRKRPVRKKPARRATSRSRTGSKPRGRVSAPKRSGLKRLSTIH